MKYCFQCPFYQLGWCTIYGKMMCRLHAPCKVGLDRFANDGKQQNKTMKKGMKKNADK